MSLHQAFRGASRGLPISAFVAVGGMLALSSCTGFKQAVGLEPTMPNEFAVESNPPLTIPPDFDLRPPEPGAPRPQEESMAKQAQQVIDQAGPGAPGQQASQYRLQRSPNDLGGAQSPNPNAMVTTESLSSKLLGYGNSGTAGATVEKRETEPLKGVY